MLVSTSRSVVPAVTMESAGYDSERAAYSCVASYAQLYKGIESAASRRNAIDYFRVGEDPRSAL